MLQRPVAPYFPGVQRLAGLTRHGGVIHVRRSGKSTLDGHYSARVRRTKLCIRMDIMRATIICGAGKGRVMQGESMALVGSMLDNGDEIISTPQGCQMFCIP
ncbi:PAAR domain-containing protein [Klebsiella pneumoniae subsp. pneumoniae]|nr:PAAR domain-containing protein [Klebsiella pneumoniae subsp. pneumoniae]